MEKFVNRIIQGDCREIMRQMPPESVDLVMFSPPYWGLRNYGEGTETVWGDGWRGQLGLEPDFRMYIEHLVEIGGQVWRVLKKTGSWYLNLGDTYFEKQLLGIPWRIALALQERGWLLRNSIIWYKPNAIPSSVKDRLTNTYEYVFFFVKSKRYYYDLDAIREPHSAATIRRISERTILQQQGGPKQDALNPKTGNTKSNFNRPAEMAKSLARKLVKHDPEGRDKTANEEVFKVGGMRLPPEPGEEGAFHPLGKNPGDVVLSPSEIAFLHGYDPEGVCPICGRKWKRHVMGGRLKRKGTPYEQAEFIPCSQSGANPRDFWKVATKPFKDAHFAVYPPKICVRPILSSCPPDGVVLDPMCGSGTTCAVAKALGRYYIGIDINPEYVEMARKRVARVVSPLAPITKLREAIEAVRAVG